MIPLRSSGGTGVQETFATELLTTDTVIVAGPLSGTVNKRT